MTLNEVQDQIVAVISRHVDRKHREGDGWMALGLAELGIDSLTIAEIGFELEEAFGIEIDVGKIGGRITKMNAVEARDALADMVVNLQNGQASTCAAG